MHCCIRDGKAPWYHPASEKRMLSALARRRCRPLPHPGNGGLPSVPTRKSPSAQKLQDCFTGAARGLAPTALSLYSDKTATLSLLSCFVIFSHYTAGTPPRQDQVCRPPRCAAPLFGRRRKNGPLPHRAAPAALVSLSGCGIPAVLQMRPSPVARPAGDCPLTGLCKHDKIKVTADGENTVCTKRKKGGCRHENGRHFVGL